MIWHIYLTGITILVVAIIVNGLAQVAGVTTWYGFISSIQTQGFIQATRNESILSIGFLFVLYPGILGMTGYFLVRFFLK